MRFCTIENTKTSFPLGICLEEWKIREWIDCKKIDSLIFFITIVSTILNLILWISQKIESMLMGMNRRQVKWKEVRQIGNFLVIFHFSSNCCFRSTTQIRWCGVFSLGKMSIVKRFSSVIVFYDYSVVKLSLPFPNISMRSPTITTLSCGTTVTGNQSYQAVTWFNNWK